MRSQRSSPVPFYRGTIARMVPTPNEIEASLKIPEDLASALLAHVAEQDANRGDWPNPRDADQPQPPWPADDSPVLRYLLHKAEASMAAGMDRTAAMLQLAVHAWFEGGIENYDRGQRDARTPRAT
jgi:hypothetical protein